MIFESTHIKGKGRGKPMGFPTINLEIPENFKLKNGIYAAKVTIENKTFVAALHYGPVPTFGDLQKSLEVYLIGVTPLRQGFAGQARIYFSQIKLPITKISMPLLMKVE